MTKEEFEKRLLELQPKLKKLSCILQPYDEESAKDLLQETYLKALLYRKNYKQEDNFAGWVNTIMRNMFINDFRKNKRVEEYNIVPYTVNTVDNRMDFLEIAHRQKRIQRLKKEDKEICLLYGAGFKYSEIAVIKRIPPGTLKSKIFEIRKTLKSTKNNKHQET